MKKQSNLSASGRNTSVLFLVGGLMLWLLSQGKRSTSTNQKGLVQNILTKSGYSERMAKWWSAVSAHETGNWTSKLYVKYHNMFGMMQPNQRVTLSLGPVKASEGNFASFANDGDSVRDLVLYLMARGYPFDFNSVDEMVSFMKDKGYFTAPLSIYLNSVKSRL